MNILLTSAGRRSYLVEYFKVAIGSEGKVVASNSEPCPAFYAADDSVITPLIYSGEYIPFLLMYCEINSIDLLIPLFDIDIPVLAAAKHAFACIGTTVITPDSAIAEICNDKWKTANHLKQQGLCVPETALGLQAARDAITTGGLSFPLMLKPRWGMASMGMFVAYSDDELDTLYTVVARIIRDSYMKHESYSGTGPEIIVQEYITGDEYGLDVICDLEGRYEATIVKKKIGMRSGETDSALVVRSLILEEIGERIAHVCPHPGNMDVDVFLKDKQYYILEMNARFGGGYPFTHASGIDLPSAIVSWGKGEIIDSSMFIPKENTFSYKDITIKVPKVRCQ